MLTPTRHCPSPLTNHTDVIVRGVRHTAAVGWDPWLVLARRRELVLGLEALPGALAGLFVPPASIVLDRQLGRRDRRSQLAHELVHHERGGSPAYEGQPPSWAAVVAREELLVDRVVARRLVPAAALEAFVRARMELGPVTADDVAEEFDVGELVAATALAELARIWGHLGH